MKHLFLILSGIIGLNSCIGTDLIEEIQVPEQILISPNISSVKIGDEVQFNAVYTNKYGMLENKQVIWSTTTPELVNVSSTGLVKALESGEAIIKAIAENVVSTRILNISSDIMPDTTAFQRNGTFISAGSGSYTVSGDVVITTIAGKSKIMVKENFKVSSGPSLFLLLTNHTNGSYMVVNNNPAINGTSAQYALLYCTLGPVFGYAEVICQIILRFFNYF